MVEQVNAENPVLSGNVYIFQAFDIGDEINLEKVKTSGYITPKTVTLSKYFKNYHIPLAVELPKKTTPSFCSSVKIHNFGVVSLTYKFPFRNTLEELRSQLDSIDTTFQEQSLQDVGALFQRLKPFVTKPKFFHTRSSYLIIQVDPDPKNISTSTLKESYSSLIASTLRFETKSLAEYQKNEIMESSIGYFKGDLIVIDTKAAFVYDPEYEEALDFFEFANIQDLELRYFDRLLDQQLNIIYEEKSRNVSLKAYLPFIGTLSPSAIDELGKMKVDISVITERLENNIKFIGEPYFSELYALLSSKLDLPNRQAAIEKKLTIVHDIRSVLESKVNAIKEDMLTVLIIVLIFIEVILGLANRH